MVIKIRCRFIAYAPEERERISAAMSDVAVAVCVWGVLILEVKMSARAFALQSAQTPHTTAGVSPSDDE
jgi:hypothetical protein